MNDDLRRAHRNAVVLGWVVTALISALSLIGFTWLGATIAQWVMSP